MALNYFIGWSQADLETALRRAQEDLAAGKSIESTRAGDVGKTERHEKDIETRIELILSALSKIAPELYPAAETRKVTRAKANFWAGNELTTESIS